jgi:hypothetical protein
VDHEVSQERTHNFEMGGKGADIEATSNLCLILGRGAVRGDLCSSQNLTIFRH